MPSVTFDEELLRRMSDVIVAVNRRRHAESHTRSLDDPAQLRALAAEEERAEEAYVQALRTRGWTSPYAMARVSA